MPRLHQWAREGVQGEPLQRHRPRGGDHALRTFDEYVEEGIAKRQSPDPSRARALRKEAEGSYEVLRSFLDAVPLSDRNANHVIKNAYDIIMELVRSKMLEQGYNTEGRGAHEAEVAYMERLGLPAHRLEFADRLRYYRNGIVYYGKSFDAAYAEKVLTFLHEVRTLCQAR